MSVPAPSFPAPEPAARVALVTGGGRGIGRACAFKLASLGMKVGVVARSLEEVDEVASLIHEGGGQSTSAVCDVSRESSVEAAVAAVVKRLGPVDILVNNAGQSLQQALPHLEKADWDNILGVNLTGTFLVTRAVLPGMLERGWGRVINIASVAGLRGLRYGAAYAAAKHGVVGFTRSVALEVARKGVTVNAVCPGWTETDMLVDALEAIQERTGRDSASAQQVLLETVPTRTFVAPDAVASLVAFLAGESARDVTGASLVMDGGVLA